MKKNTCLSFFIFLSLFCCSQDEQTLGDKAFDEFLIENGEQTVIYTTDEQTLWDMAFDQFLIENGEQNVIYTTFDYTNIESDDTMKVLFIYKLSEPEGIIIYTNGSALINYFKVLYSYEYNTLIWEDLHGGLSAWKKARDIIDLILNSALHIGICNDLRELVP